MKTYNIFKKIVRTAVATILLFPAVTTTSCSDSDPARSGPYLHIENPKIYSNTSAVTRVPSYSEFGCQIAPIIASSKFSDALDSLQAHTITLISYDIRSNRDWEVFVEGDNAEWLRINPAPRGSGDGRIFLTATNNYSTVERSTTAYIRYSDGSYSEASLAVTQLANAPFLITRVDGKDATQVTVDKNSHTYELTVGSNIDYFYSTEGDFFKLTENGNGLFTLEVEAYPEDTADLERSGAINFKGVGEYSDMGGQLTILQTIRPAITVVGLEDDTISFGGSDKTPFSFTVSANYDWSVDIDFEDNDPWYTVTPLVGVADETVTIIVTPSDAIERPRSNSFTITTEEKNGATATYSVLVKQAAGSGGSGMTGLQEPVEWFFDGSQAAQATGYPDQKAQFVEGNQLLAVKGMGILSYKHTYTETTGLPNTNLVRFIGGTGQPYITGAWPGDYWLFEVPVTKFEAGTRVRFTGTTRTSATGQHYWLMEFCDGTTDGDWKPVIDTKTATVSGQDVTYTHAVPVDNMVVDFTVTYTNAIPNGSVRFRMTCQANWQSNGAGALNAPNGGTIRWASSEKDSSGNTINFKDSPKIQVVW